MADEALGSVGPEMEEIPPTEDLMREHGVLKRILLIYGDVIKRLIGEKHYDPRLISSVLYYTASIASNFIEEYHQELEEQYVFPKFLQAGKHTQFVRVLQNQHQAARKITRLILHYASAPRNFNFSERYHMSHLLSMYIRMYEPHEAREDTVLFPDFRSIIGPEEFIRLGKRFEEIEEERFGGNGFRRIVQQIAQIEQSLGIYELSQFTPLF